MGVKICLTLREEYRLRVFGNRILRRIFGSKRDQVVGGWMKLHNKELYYFYSLPNAIRIIKLRRMKGVRHIARMGEKRTAYVLLVGKPKRKTALGRHRWMDNIKIDLVEIGWGGVD
jgi:hypothetical protein